ncbi:MAG: hypothetical protein H6729_13355 [Deltaproteobacteria bacterium]|nr:hypothetical protein [Deltaproteobacteria bacterium]
MSVREHLLALYRLQKIDTAAQELARGGEAIPERISETERAVDALRVDLGQLNAEADAQRAQQRELELQISEETNKHRQWKRRLNDIKSPREYQAMSRELESGERTVRAFEESVLQIMQELESKQQVIDEKAKVLRERELDSNEKVRDLRERAAQIAADVAAARAGRHAVIETLPENLVTRYEQVRKQRRGIAVAVVEAGKCGGCHVTLRPQAVVELLRNTDIQTCPLCHRILVPDELLKDGTSSDAASAAT